MLLHTGESETGVHITYTSPPGNNPSQKVQLCSWCKKSSAIKDFTSSDGEKLISCKGLCSALCFEQTVKNIKENEKHINSTQDVLRSHRIPGTNKFGECKVLSLLLVTEIATP